MSELNVGVEAPLEPQDSQVTTPVVNTPPATPQAPTEPVEKPESVEQPELPRLEVAEHYEDDVKNIVTTLNHLMPNMDLQRAFGQALDSGDSQAIDRNYLREMVGDENIANAIANTIGMVADSYGDVTDQAYTEVFESVGGQEQWQGIANFFNSNATESEKNYARRLTTSKNPKEIKEGAEFVKAYAQRMGAISKTPAKIGSGAGAIGGQGLSEQEYREKYREIRSTLWNSNRLEAERQIREIDQQRIIGKQLGR